jgi:ribosomal-protein-alanine N-acetyltransferase
MPAVPEAEEVSLTTARLHLREFWVNDHPAVQAYASDPLVTRFTGWGPNTDAMTTGVLLSWQEERNKTPRVEWPIAIVKRDDGVLIGSTGIGAVDWRTGSAVFGYVLRRDAWGCGFATEAGRAVVDWAFDRLGLTRLTAHCDMANGASLHVLSKLGFRQEGGLIPLEKENGDRLSLLEFIRIRPD